MKKKLKICGLTEVLEAEYVNEAGADFAGFIQFYPKSKRNIPTEKAKEIMKALKPGITPVAVVVSPTLDQVREIEAAGFGLIQIHGALPEELLSQIKLPVIKAFNVNDLSDFKRFSESDHVAGYVFDAHVPGSGKTFDWSVLDKIPKDSKMKLLAGGIDAGNVKMALSVEGIDGIDASSSVENDNGIGKNKEKIMALARRTYAEEI